MNGGSAQKARLRNTRKTRKWKNDLLIYSFRIFRVFRSSKTSQFKESVSQIVKDRHFFTSDLLISGVHKCCFVLNAVHPEPCPEPAEGLPEGCRKGVEGLAVSMNVDLAGNIRRSPNSKGIPPNVQSLSGFNFFHSLTLIPSWLLYHLFKISIPRNDTPTKICPSKKKIGGPQ